MRHALQQRQEDTQWVALCCVCGDARDDIAADGAWVGLKTYLSTHGLRENDLVITHTFCPFCYMHYRQLLGLEPAPPTPQVALGEKA